MQLRLDDQQLLQQINHLVGQQRENMVALIIHLSELDRRKLHLALGFTGLFSYLNHKLLFSESSAWRYHQAVRVFEAERILGNHFIEGKIKQQQGLKPYPSVAKQCSDRSHL